MNIARLLGGFGVAVAVFAAAACGSAESKNITTESETAMENNVYAASTENVKPLGRTLFDEGLLWCAFSGTGAEFTCTGSECTVKIQGDRVSQSSSNDGNYARIAIYVDGERVIDDMIDQPEKSYTFQAENADVRIIKLSETAMSCFAVKEISVTGGEIKPAENRDLFIEFVGDSITCGYGVDDEDKMHHFSTATEDVTKAYAYQTAQALGADHSMVSISGYGIISGYTDGDEPVKAQTIPQYYEKLGFSYGDFGLDKPHNYKWDFSRQPDLVVINLGTNDDSYCKDNADRQNEYREGYIELLKKIRKNNPDAKILCTLGIMGNRLFPTIQQAVSDYTAETGDANIDTMKFTPQSEAEDGIAADWHPSYKTHTKAAKMLTEKIKEILNLN